MYITYPYNMATWFYEYAQLGDVTVSYVYMVHIYIAT